MHGQSISGPPVWNGGDAARIAPPSLSTLAAVCLANTAEHGLSDDERKGGTAMEGQEASESREPN